jgi:hypothetical protein
MTLSTLRCVAVFSVLGALPISMLPRAAAAPAAALPEGIVIFPFDDYTLPLNKGLVLSLVAGRKHARQDPLHPNKPVVSIGQKGEPDDRRIRFYGTVLHVDGEYRMWYAANTHICYAVSRDGLNWEKPNLGLAEYNGSKANNIVTIDGEPLVGMNSFVLHEPEDPDPERRFKLLWEDAIPGVSWPVFVAVSRDGVRWKRAAGGKPINPTHQIEPTGFIKYKGMYYVNGHSRSILHPVPGAHKRTMQTFASADFETWTSAAVMSFRRDNLPPKPIHDFEGHRGEQVHVGASIWNRGNVLLGFYGQYHNETNDRRTSTCDIGFIVSNNALNFREPLPDFKMIPSFEEPDRAEQRLIQGQGFQNIGDRTLVYYGIWPEMDRSSPTGVRVATWERDRLGYYSPGPDLDDPHCITMPLSFPAGAKLYVNADGLSEDSQLAVEILDERFRPIAGYAGTDSRALSASGLKVPATWRGGDKLPGSDGPVRVRVRWSGASRQKARLFAMYVE